MKYLVIFCILCYISEILITCWTMYPAHSYHEHVVLTYSCEEGPDLCLAPELLVQEEPALHHPHRPLVCGTQVPVTLLACRHMYCTLYNVQCTYSYIVYIKLTSTVIKLPSNLNPKICNYWLSNKRAGLHGFLFPFHAYLSQQENYIYSALFYLFYDHEDCDQYYRIK